ENRCVSTATRQLSARCPPCPWREREATLKGDPMAQRRIRISAGAVSGEAELNESATAPAIWGALPRSAAGDTRGGAIYFAIPVKAKSESQRDVVELGDLAYWPPGSAFCIFFGPTPASRGGEIRPASPVNVFGRLTGDATAFKKVRAGTVVRVERA